MKSVISGMEMMRRGSGGDGVTDKREDGDEIVTGDVGFESSGANQDMASH